MKDVIALHSNPTVVTIDLVLQGLILSKKKNRLLPQNSFTEAANEEIDAALLRATSGGCGKSPRRKAWGLPQKKLPRCLQGTPLQARRRQMTL